MALNSLQLTVLRLLAERRKQSGESYVAGGVALNYALRAPRISRDVDKEAIVEAKVILNTLPDEEIGCCLLKQDGTPYSELPDRLAADLLSGHVIRFHRGSIGGVWPVIVA